MIIIINEEALGMDANVMTGEMLYYAFLSGTIEVKKQKNRLNKINVFPIPDGDTGSNLISTMNSIVEETQMHPSITETLNSMANAALNGARGNSGIIFAQFINGINEEMSQKAEKLSISSFVESLKGAVPYAYNAIMNPVEGTMVTVIREWVEAVDRLKDVARNFEDLIIRTLEDARKSLADTPNKLEILKKSSVVDSGASGFVLFLEGVVKFLQNKDIKILSRKEEEIFIDEEEAYELDGDLTFRYCTEALITGESLNQESIKIAISELGDSQIVAGNSKKVRIHIHTDKPDEVFSVLRNWGTIVQQKVDDMKRQYDVVNHRLSNTAILTDSIADLPQELIELYQIHVIPLNLVIEGSPYLDKITIKPDRFYKMLDGLEEFPTSSQPTIKSVENIYSFLTTHYDNIITILVSQKMSGTYNTVKTAADQFVKEGKNIVVVDSKLNSGAQGLLVLEAAKAIQEGVRYDEVIKMIEDFINKTKIYVSIKTLKYMVRGGRISAMKGVVGKLLNLKPIISIDDKGKGIAFGKAFSSKANIKKIIAIAKKAHMENKILTYCIVHANALQESEALGLQLTELIGIKPTYITEISPIVGLNAGIGSIAIAFKTAN